VKNKTFLLVLSLLAISPARADIAQVRTPFWQATYEKNLVVKLVAVDRNLDHVCKEFRDLVILSPGKTDLEPAEFAQMRNQTDSITSQGFSANFEVELSAVTAAEGNGAMLGNAAQPRTALPEFDQKIARVVPTVAPIIGSDGQQKILSPGLRNRSDLKVSGKDFWGPITQRWFKFSGKTSPVISIAVMRIWSMNRRLKFQSL
jgi:hypothetical protein